MKNLYLKINLQKVEENISIIRNILGNKKLIAVVKGDAYGLGITKVCEFLQDKVDMFAVSNLNEAIKVSQLGIEKKILILTPIISKEYFENEVIKNFIVTIDSKEVISWIPKEMNIDAHIYVCTGMNRKGIRPEELQDFIIDIEENYKNINIKGIYTHLHNVKNTEYTLKQIDKFYNCIKHYENKYFIHILNSGGLVNEQIRKKADFSHGVRVGNLIYGYDGYSIGINQSFGYYAKVIDLYQVKKGETVGYGCTYLCKEDKQIGILEIGSIQHFGFYRKYTKNFFYDLLKFFYRYFIKECELYKGNEKIHIIGKCNMNLTLIDGEKVNIGDYIKVNMSPILGDSSIHKEYIFGE